MAKVELLGPCVDFAIEVIPSSPFLKLQLLIAHLQQEFLNTILYLNVFNGNNIVGMDVIGVECHIAIDVTFDSSCYRC